MAGIERVHPKRQTNLSDLRKVIFQMEIMHYENSQLSTNSEFVIPNHSQSLSIPTRNADTDLDS